MTQFIIKKLLLHLSRAKGILQSEGFLWKGVPGTFGEGIPLELLESTDIKNGANTVCLYPFTGFSMNQANLYLTRPFTSKPVNLLLASPNGNLHLKQGFLEVPC